MVKNKTSHYSAEFKKSSAKLASESDQSVNKTAKDLGLNPSTLHGWVQSYYPNKNIPKTNNLPVDTQAEIKHLKKALARVTQERDILKKAAVYFANEAQ